MENNLPDILKVHDIQVYLRISKSKAYNLFARTDFPTLVIGGNKRVNKRDFLLWLEKQKERGN